VLLWVEDHTDHSNKDAKYRRKLAKQSKVKQPRSRASIQGLFSASASTMSLKASRFFGKAPQALPPVHEADQSNTGLSIRSAFDRKPSEDMGDVEGFENKPRQVMFENFDLKAEELYLELFHPQDPEDHENSAVPDKELSLLLSHRNLRVLKITGMLESYQQYIWQAVWMNPHLEVLELEMALEPEIPGETYQFRPIRGDWTPLIEQEAKPTYL
jgi:hypothetical protein